MRPEGSFAGKQHCDLSWKLKKNSYQDTIDDMKGYVMSQIDELLKINDYNIYDNLSIGDKEIRTLAKIISDDKRIKLEDYFDLLKCSSKFCWFNYLKILEEMPKKERVRGFPILFELLQDDNWPTFQKTLEILENTDKNVLEPFLNRYLKQAYAEDDEMWFLNMQALIERLR